MARNSQKQYVEIKSPENSFILDSVGSQPRTITALHILGQSLRGMPELKVVMKYFEDQKYFPQIYANMTSYLVCRLYFSEEGRKKSDAKQIQGVLYLQVSTTLINLLNK